MKRSDSGELLVLVAGVIKSFAAVLEIGFFSSFPSIALKVLIVVVQRLGVVKCRGVVKVFGTSMSLFSIL